VTGIIHPEKVLTNAGAKPGDVLILTKPLGLGIITTALKRGLADAETTQTAIEIMSTLNRAAAEALTELPVNACTDITGFGLLGHLKEMAQGSGVNVEISADSVPVLEAAKEFITANVIPGGTLNNMEYVADVVTWSPEISRTLRTLLCDAQTSGGLLISVPAEHSEKATETLLAKGVKAAKIVGQVTGLSDGRIVVRPG